MSIRFNPGRRHLLKASLKLGGGLAIASTLGAQALSGKPKAMRYDEYVTHDATSLAGLVAKGDVTPSELLDLAIDRANAVNDKINAINIPFYNKAREAVKHGLPNGPLKGVPWLLKDLHLQYKGTITSYGSRFFKDHVADHDSTLVKRYRDAGLVTFGKTHSPEFGGTATTESALWGETRNPWNLEYSSGGSSGGAAAAVAAGILPAANASDGGGSIRIPASACGLFGLKPTRARVPLGPGRFEGANGQSVVHAVTRSVRDSALILDISRGPETGMPYHAPAVEMPYVDELKRDPGKLRIALVTEPVFPLPVDKDCKQATVEAAKLCESLGHTVVAAKPAIPAQEYYGAVGTISSVGTLSMVRAREAVLGRKVTREDLEPLMYARMENGKKVSGLEYANARAVYHKMGAVLADFHTQYDLILCPTMAAAPPKLGVMSLSGNYETFMQAAVAASVFTQLYNVTGAPAMTVPFSTNANNLPIGVMFAAPFGDEATLFRFAAQLEQARPWFNKLPDVR